MKEKARMHLEELKPMLGLNLHIMVRICKHQYLHHLLKLVILLHRHQIQLLAIIKVELYTGLFYRLNGQYRQDLMRG